MTDKKIAIVTGAATGIGEATAERLAAEGARVVVNDVNPAGAEVAQRIGGLFIQADLSQRADCRTIVECTLAEFGTVHILVNNAGIQHVAPIDEFPENAWDKLLAVMLTAPFLLTRYVWPHMKAQGWGRLINIASISSLRAEPNKSAYNTAKTGLLGLTRTLAIEGGPLGITAHAVCPGLVHTGLIDKQIPDIARTQGIPEDKVMDYFLENSPIKRAIQPREIAALVAFLCSDEAAMMTGAPVLIDQGLSAVHP